MKQGKERNETSEVSGSTVHFVVLFHEFRAYASFY